MPAETDSTADSSAGRGTGRGADGAWEITGPTTLDVPAPVDTLHVRLVNGTVNVVGGEGPGARVEVSGVSGPPLQVTRKGATLEVSYEDVPWKGFLKWLDRKGWHRSAVVSVSVPAHVRLTVGVVGASAVVSGVTGRTEVRGVSGATTLVGLGGRVRADTVSGDVEAQSLTGGLAFSSVSGGLTVIDGGGEEFRADTVNGPVMLDLAPVAEGAPVPDVGVNTVSGEVAVRVPDAWDARVEMNTASGAVSTAFEGLCGGGQWGAKHLSGKLRSGRGRLRAATVSGSVALLRRPADPDDASGPDDTPATPSFSKDV